MTPQTSPILSFINFHLSTFNHQLPSLYVFFGHSGSIVHSGHHGLVSVIMCRPLCSALSTECCNHLLSSTNLHLLTLYYTMYVCSLLSLPIFANNHMPSSKVSHYCLLLPYLVHLCVSLHHPGHLSMDQKATLKALKANIMEACTNHKLVHSKGKNYQACVSIRTDYFMKFGDPDDLWPELHTQSYIFNYARSNPHSDVPRIPQVFHHFRDSSTKYLVMEFITLTAAPLDSTGSCMTLEHPTSSQSCDWSLRGWSHPPPIL
jgi:hypothetical protein